MSGECDICGEHCLDCACKEHQEYQLHLNYMEKTYLLKGTEINVDSPDFFEGMKKLDTLRANLMRKQQKGLLKGK